MATLVLDDLCSTQRDQLAHVPVSAQRDWRVSGHLDFPAFFLSLCNSTRALQGGLIDVRTAVPINCAVEGA